MTLRAVLFGLSIALLISAATYFNDSVVRQSHLIGHFLPSGVVGPILIWALLINPLLARLRPAFALRGREVLIAAAIGMAACSYPGNGFYRWFANGQVMPAHLLNSRTHWKATGVMDYVPEGTGAVVQDAQWDQQLVDDFRVGLGDDAGIADVPWSVWQPVLMRWGGLALLLGAASICLAVIVHPQWSHNEQLAYPVVRFFEQIAPPAGDRPRIDGLFLWGFGITFTLHLINGLDAWGLGFDSIPTGFSMHALRDLVPGVAQAGGNNALFNITLIPSVIAFCWFVQTRVTLSVGLSNVFWVLLGTVLVWRGSSLGAVADGHAQAMLSTGAALGVAVMVLYLGRCHYVAVLCRMVGIRLEAENPPPRACVWAGWLLAGFVFLATYWLSGAGVHWSLALFFVLITLMMFMVIARINVETGLIFIQLAFGPAAVLLAWCGFETLGPTGFLVLMIANVMVLSDPRQALFAFIANSLRLIDREGKASGKAAPVLGAVVLGGFLIAGVATLTMQYQRGVDANDWVAAELQPAMAFEHTSRQITNARAFGKFEEAEAAGGLAWLGGIGHDWQVIGLAGLGFALFVGCAFLMLRVPKWPLHPVIFVIWGTLPSMWFGWSFLIGWLIKISVVNMGGHSAYRKLTPLIAGLIAGEVLAALGWIAVGATYYFVNGTIPPRYSILPG